MPVDDQHQLTFSVRFGHTPAVAKLSFAQGWNYLNDRFQALPDDEPRFFCIEASNGQLLLECFDRQHWVAACGTPRQCLAYWQIIGWDRATVTVEARSARPPARPARTWR